MTMQSTDLAFGLKGEVSREFGVISKTPKRIFFNQQKPKRIAQICCKLSPQCTETIDECPWPQMDCVRMDCNLKKVRLTVFKFSHFHSPKYTRAGHELFLSRIQLISFS